jgi:nicotinate-nucleotide adenylyltransferase
MKIGILGGTFDPPHFGHLALANAALDQLELDEVMFLPANTNPFKQGKRSSPAKVRFEMTQLLVQNAPKMAVSDMEITRGGVSYTIDTIGELQMVQPAEYWIILGADSLKGFESWKNPQRILRAARLAVTARLPIVRSELLRTVPEDFHSRIDIVEMDSMPQSSTEIRDRVQRNLPIQSYTPPLVVDYIKRNKLYK